MKSPLPTIAPPRVASHPAGLPEISVGGHITVLDGLRGVAVLLVMSLHLLVTAATVEAATGTWLAPLQKVWLRGWIGVDLFFVLSGFLITGILYDAKGSTGYFRNFYMRRSLRIFPLYYVTLAAFFVVVPGVLHHYPPAGVALERVAHGVATRLDNLAQWQNWFWFYGTNFFVVFHGQRGEGTVLAHLWSLSVEEHFYLIWPLVVYLCSRRVLLWVCAATLVGATFCRWLCWQIGLPDYAAYNLTPCRMDALTMGGLAALLIRGPTGSTAVYGFARRAAMIVTPCAVLSLIVWGDPKDYPMGVVGLSFLAITFAVLLLALLGMPPGGVVARVFSHPALRWFGKYSYGLYVIHNILRVSVPFEAFRPRLEAAFGSAPAAILAYGGAALVVSMVLAQISWVLLEQPCLRLKRFFPTPAGRPRRQTTPDAAHGAAVAPAAPEGLTAKPSA